MKIISWNVNGIRMGADVVCLQEIKAQTEEIEAVYPTATLFEPPQYRVYANPATRKGYSGVAVFTRKEPLVVWNRLGHDRFDQEGRVLQLEYQDLTLFNLYIPHGGRQKENMDYKLEVYVHLCQHLRDSEAKAVVLAGDFNVAHEEVDLARPRENQNNTMFTREERAAFDELLGIGFVDSFRMLHKGDGHYTWWPYGNEARERNIGWRIDYVLVSNLLSNRVRSAFILPEVGGSDHCPVGIEL
jgi:exodeoxyribonuclease-3